MSLEGTAEQAMHFIDASASWAEGAEGCRLLVCADLLSAPQTSASPCSVSIAQQVAPSLGPQGLWGGDLVRM